MQKNIQYSITRKEYIKKTNYRPFRQIIDRFLMNSQLALLLLTEQIMRKLLQHLCSTFMQFNKRLIINHSYDGQGTDFYSTWDFSKDFEKIPRENFDKNRNLLNSFYECLFTIFDNSIVRSEQIYIQTIKTAYQIFVQKLYIMKVSAIKYFILKLIRIREDQNFSEKLETIRKNTIYFIFDVLKQKLRLQQNLFQNTVSAKYVHHDDDVNFVRNQCRSFLQGMIDKISLQNSDDQLNEEKQKKGRYGWCIQCRSSANYYSYKEKVPLCSYICKFQYQSSENKCMQIFQKGEKDLETQLQFKQEYIEIFELLQQFIFGQYQTIQSEFAYEIFTNIFEQPGEILQRDYQMINFLKDQICNKMFFLKTQHVQLHLKLNQKMFLILFQHYRKYLYKEILLLFNKVFFDFFKTGLKEVNQHYFEFLEYLIKIKPNFIYEFFVNYDMKDGQENVVENLFIALLKYSSGGFNFVGSQVFGENNGHMQRANNTLLTIIKSFSSYLYYKPYGNNTSNSASVKSFKQNLKNTYYGQIVSFLKQIDIDQNYLSFQKNYDQFLEKVNNDDFNKDALYCFLLNMIFEKNQSIYGILIDCLQRILQNSNNKQNVMKQFRGQSFSNHYFDFSLQQKNSLKKLILEKSSREDAQFQIYDQEKYRQDTMYQIRFQFEDVKFFFHTFWNQFMTFLNIVTDYQQTVDNLALIDTIVSLIKIAHYFDMKEEKMKLMQLLINKSKVRELDTHLLDNFNIRFLSALLDFNISDCHDGGYKQLFEVYLILNYCDNRIGLIKGQQELSLEETNLKNLEQISTQKNLDYFIKSTKKLYPDQFMILLKEICMLCQDYFINKKPFFHLCFEQLIRIVQENKKRHFVDFLLAWNIFEKFYVQMIQEMKDYHIRYFIFSIDILKHLIFQILAIDGIIQNGFDGVVLNILTQLLKNQKYPSIVDYISLLQYSIFNKLKYLMSDKGLSTIIKSFIEQSKQIEFLDDSSVTENVKDLNIKFFQQLLNEEQIFKRLNQDMIDDVIILIEFITNQSNQEFAAKGFDCYTLLVNSKKLDQEHILQKIIQTLENQQLNLQLNESNFILFLQSFLGFLNSIQNILPKNLYFDKVINSILSILNNEQFDISEKTQKIVINILLQYCNKEEQYIKQFFKEWNTNQNKKNFLKQSQCYDDIVFDLKNEKVLSQIFYDDLIFNLFDKFLPKEIIKSQLWNSMIFNQKVIKSDELMVDYVSQSKDNETKIWIIEKLSELLLLSVKNFKLEKNLQNSILLKIENLSKLSTIFMEAPKKRFVLWIKGFQSNSESIPNLMIFQENIYRAKSIIMANNVDKKFLEFFNYILQKIISLKQQLSQIFSQKGDLIFIEPESLNKIYITLFIVELRKAIIMYLNIVNDHLIKPLIQCDCLKQLDRNQKYELMKNLLQVNSMVGENGVELFRCQNCVRCKCYTEEQNFQNRQFDPRQLMNKLLEDLCNIDQNGNS